MDLPLQHQIRRLRVERHDYMVLDALQGLDQFGDCVPAFLHYCCAVLEAGCALIVERGGGDAEFVVET